MLSKQSAFAVSNLREWRSLPTHETLASNSFHRCMWKNNSQGFTDSLKLTIITQFYPPDYAATGQLISELATYLGHQGVEVQVFTGQPSYAFQQEQAPTVEWGDRLTIKRSVSSRFWSDKIWGKAINGLLFCLHSGLYLLKYVARNDVLLVTTAPPYLPILGYLFHLVFGKPYICVLYDLYPDIAIELDVVSTNHWLTQFWIWLNRQIWRRAQAIVVLSSTMKSRVVDRCPAIADKVVVIHNWADPGWIVPIKKQHNWFAHRHRLVEPFTVLYSGNLGRCHDVTTILEAVIQLRSESIQFVFIGDGANRQPLMQQVAALGLTNCQFLPYQDRQCLPYSLTSCDLHLLSMGIGMEGLIAPSKLYSSLASGRPVAAICEPHSYLRSVIADAECGEAFNLGDSNGLAEFIQRLRCNPTTAMTMGTSGRQYCETHFTLDSIAQQYLQLLQQPVICHWQRSPALLKVKETNPIHL